MPLKSLALDVDIGLVADVKTKSAPTFLYGEKRTTFSSSAPLQI